jgi:hypothetical protein
VQEWLFLALVNHQNGFIWRYFYRHPGVLRAHIEMYGGATCICRWCCAPGKPDRQQCIKLNYSSSHTG